MVIVDKQIRFIYILPLILILGCYPNRVKKSFRESKYCHTNEMSSLDNKIKLNGPYTSVLSYYSKGNPVLNTVKGIKTDTIRIFFYSSGMALNYSKNSNFLMGSTYYFSNDSIYLLTVSGPTNTPKYLKYECYKIINDTTLQYLGFSDKEIDSNRFDLFRNSTENDLYGTYSEASFEYLEDIPDENSLYLKSRKWIWCNKKAFKKWKKINK